MDLWWAILLPPNFVSLSPDRSRKGKGLKPQEEKEKNHEKKPCRQTTVIWPERMNIKKELCLLRS